MSGRVQQLIEHGMRIADAQLFREDKIWSQYSNDKVDIGEELAKVMRTLAKALPLSTTIRALSLGSSNEPQFRQLQAACAGGVYLLDKEEEALDIIRERVSRQHTRNVTAVHGDFKKIFLNAAKTGQFLENTMGGKKVHLVSLHHSLYYCPAPWWKELLRNLYGRVLSGPGAVHCALMAAKSDDCTTTTWLYNHFAGKFFAHVNNQSLYRLKRELEEDRVFRGAQFLFKTGRVRFFVNDFEKLMAVVWMILLYPHVHPYTTAQRRQITQYVYENFFKKRIPLMQDQDHLVIYKGIAFKGLV